MIACPRCKGTGQGGVAFVSSRTGHFTTETVCNICLGAGNVSAAVGDWVVMGEMHRKARVEEGIGLHERAAALGVTPARLSAMETGRADPAMLEESK
jgi:hypothetical protein